MTVLSTLFIPRLDGGPSATQLLHRRGAVGHQRSVSVAFTCHF